MKKFIVLLMLFPSLAFAGSVEFIAPLFSGFAPEVKGVRFQLSEHLDGSFPNRPHYIDIIPEQTALFTIQESYYNYDVLTKSALLKFFDESDILYYVRPVVFLEEPLYGDYNRDGRVDLKDVLGILQLVCGIE